MTRLITPLAVLLLTDVLNTVHADDTEQAASVIQHVLAVEDAVLSGSTKATLADLAPHYADDVIRIIDGEPVIGIKAAKDRFQEIEKEIKNGLKDGIEFERVHKLQPLRSLSSGTAIVTVVTTTYVSKGDAVIKTREVFIYVLILERDSWKIVLETVNEK